MWCWTDTRAHLKVATHYTYVMEHAQRDLVKYIQSGVTKPLPTLRSREELPWIMGLMAPSLPTIFSCSTFWPVSTSPKSLPLSVTGNKLHGAAQQLLGDVKGLTPRTSFTAQVKYTKCTKRVSQLLEIAAVYKTNGPSIRQKRKNKKTIITEVTIADVQLSQPVNVSWTTSGRCNGLHLQRLPACRLELPAIFVTLPHNEGHAASE